VPAVATGLRLARPVPYRGCDNPGTLPLAASAASRGPRLEERRNRMPFFRELKRRKVIQTALIYLAASWLLLQVAELLLEMLDVPAWGLRLVFVLLVIGFPLALVLSWMHQLTPQGLRREDTALAPAPPPAARPPAAPPPAVPAAAEPVAPDSAAAVAAAPAVAAVDQSIAVLPFANMSDDEANVHFADGLSEELLNLLSRIRGLRVVARTSSFSFRGRQVSATTIARELNVAHLLEGSVRKAGNRLRITAQLVRASDSSHVWSQSFDRNLSDIFAVQDEIAAAVARELEITLLGGTAPKSRQTTPEAYSHYLQGRHFFELASATGYEQAIKELDDAIALDPSYAPAWSTLGALYWAGANNHLIDYAEGMRKAREATERALALDPDLAEPLSMLGSMDVIEGVDVEGGRRRMERALQFEPNNERLLTRLANIALRRGEVDEAMRHGQRALRSDPLSPIAHAVYGNSCYFAGRLEEAEAMRRKVLALSPGWLSGHFNLGKVLLARGDKLAALAEMQQEPSDFWRRTGLALVHHALGHTAESEAALRDLVAMSPHGAAYQLVQVHAYRGELGDAFEWLERAVRDHDSGLIYLKVDPLLTSLRADPRWHETLARLERDG
jgi:TolB-like protein/Tfp pilus assembly protein PilF